MSAIKRLKPILNIGSSIEMFPLLVEAAQADIGVQQLN